MEGAGEAAIELLNLSGSMAQDAVTAGAATSRNPSAAGYWP
jgi:hypothetical protein